MQYRLDDIAEIASKLTDLGPGIQRKLILITALPGVGKTTLAKEFQKQTNGIHFDIDEIKRVIVPQDVVTQGIAPPNTVTNTMQRQNAYSRISLRKVLPTR